MRYLHCTYMYVAVTVFSHSHYESIVNHSAGLIIVIHRMFDALIRRIVAPPDKVAYTNTINNVLCISDTLL